MFGMATIHVGEEILHKNVSEKYIYPNYSKMFSGIIFSTS